MGISYLSPASYMNQLPAIDKGPLSGFLSGMNQDLANQITQRGMADDDLQRQVVMQKLDEDTKGQQSKLDALAGIASKARDESRYYDSGDAAKLRTSDNAAKVSDNDYKIQENDVKKQIVAAPLWQQMADEMHQVAPNGVLDPMNQAHRQWWDDWRQKMQPFAPNMPAFPDAGDMQKVAQQGQSATQFMQAKAAGANGAFERKKELAAVAPKIHQETSEAVADKYYSRVLDKAQLDNETKQAIEALKQDKAGAEKKMSELNTRIVKKARQSGIIDEDAIASAESLAEDKFNEMLKTNPHVKLGMLSQDPEGFHDKMVAKIAEEQILPGYKIAKAKMAVGDTSPTPTKPTAASTPAATSKSYPKPNAQAIDMIKKNPNLKGKFEEMFGPGSADQYK